MQGNHAIAGSVSAAARALSPRIVADGVAGMRSPLFERQSTLKERDQGRVSHAELEPSSPHFAVPPEFSHSCLP